MSVFGTIAPDSGPPIATPPPITAWSYSRLSTYQKCPRQARYKFVDKLPEPEHEALVRGKTAHSLMAKLITDGEAACKLEPGEQELIELARPHRDLLASLHERGAQAEQQVAFRQDWSPTDWFSRDAWLRVIFDAVLLDEANARVTVYEHKTGKRHADHEHQKSLYAVSAAALAPWADQIDVAFIYLDSPPASSIMLAPYDRPSANAFRPIWEERARPMLTDTEFRPKPGAHCRWCPFSKTKGGPCEAG